MRQSVHELLCAALHVVCLFLHNQIRLADLSCNIVRTLYIRIVLLTAEHAHAVIREDLEFPEQSQKWALHTPQTRAADLMRPDLLAILPIGPAQY